MAGLVFTQPCSQVQSATGAGYYSYKWAEVLDADAFTRFPAGAASSTARVGMQFREQDFWPKGNSPGRAAELYPQFHGGGNPDLKRRCLERFRSRGARQLVLVYRGEGPRTV